MKRLALPLAIAMAGAVITSACQNSPARTSSASRSPDDRPYNLQKNQFEDPAPPKHRTSPGDAAR